MSAIDVATQIAFYAALIVGVPIILVSYRCAYILIRKADFRKNSFYRIFVASLFSNSLVFMLLMHNLRFPGMGFFPGYYDAIKQGWWLPLQSFVTRLFYNLSLMLSFVLSLNCVTRIILKEEVYKKIWRHFLLLILPAMLFWSGFLNYDVLVNRAEYVQVPHASGNVRYQFRNFNLTRNYDHYWVVVECVLDVICNAFVIYRFVQSRRVIRKGTDKVMKRTIEKSYYLISLANFILHTATTGVQTALRYDLIPQSALTITFLFSNAILDATVLLPAVFVLVFTKGVRDDFKRLLYGSIKLFAATESNTAMQSTDSPNNNDVNARGNAQIST